jgi:hypothetical protein
MFSVSWIDLDDISAIRIVCQHCKGAATIEVEPGTVEGPLICPRCKDDLIPAGSDEEKIFRALDTAISSIHSVRRMQETERPYRRSEFALRIRDYAPDSGRESKTHAPLHKAGTLFPETRSH